MTMGASVGDSDSGSTSDDGTSTGVSDTTTSSTTSTSTSSSSTTDDSTTSSSTTDEPETSSTTDEPESSSSSGGCPVGSEGCPCDAGECDGTLVCFEDNCVGVMVCEDDGVEPNESEAGASFLGEINDNDGNGSSVSGVLDGEDDVDWYVYAGDDDIGNIVDPFRSISADGGFRFCKFAECPDDSIAETEFPCPEGATEATSPDGRPGCCADDIIHVPDANCPGIDDSMDIYIRVDGAGADECVGYTVNFHF